MNSIKYHIYHILFHSQTQNIALQFSTSQPTTHHGNKTVTSKNICIALCTFKQASPYPKVYNITDLFINMVQALPLYSTTHF